MGFIDYHGTKEDRFSEVLDYAHAQQEEDWKRKQASRIRKWLYDLTGDGSQSDWYIQDLLKSVIMKYSELQLLKKKLVNDSDSLNNQPMSQIWKDFSMEYVMRHIEPFHMTCDKRNKHYDTFVRRIFKLDGCDSAEEFYEHLEQKTGYKRYLVETFDPTWKDQQFFKYLNSVAGNNKDNKEVLDKLLNTYMILGISTSLYLYQATQPRDSGWMIQEAAEWNAISELKERISAGKLPAFEDKLISNPLYTNTGKRNEDYNAKGDENSETKKEIKTTKYDDLVAELPKSKLRKKEFDAYIEEGGIPNIVNACLLILECDLPEDIKANYKQLVTRMPILQEAIEKFDEVYHADLEQFNDYYAPETLRVTATYLEYQAVFPSEKVMKDTRNNVMIATRKLVQVVDEKIDEIYRFVTIDANAEAKALEAMMSQDGYVDAKYKINK